MNDARLEQTEKPAGVGVGIGVGGYLIKLLTELCFGQRSYPASSDLRKTL